MADKHTLEELGDMARTSLFRIAMALGLKDKLDKPIPQMLHEDLAQAVFDAQNDATDAKPPKGAKAKAKAKTKAKNAKDAKPLKMTKKDLTDLQEVLAGLQALRDGTRTDMEELFGAIDGLAGDIYITKQLVYRMWREMSEDSADEAMVELQKEVDQAREQVNDPS